MKYTLTKEDDGSNFVYTYAPAKNVTVITEFYNRDGSLSTVKGGTSTYTRAIGSTIDFGTATYNRGWILESETVTGMVDTNPNNYRAQVQLVMKISRSNMYGEKITLDQMDKRQDSRSISD